MASDRDDDYRDDDRPSRRRRDDDDYDRGGGGGGRNIPNNLVMSILVTLFCCLPLGIVAIVKSASVDGLVRQGKYSEAQKAADDAKKFAMIGAIGGAIVTVGWLILNFAVIANAK